MPALGTCIPPCAASAAGSRGKDRHTRENHRHEPAAIVLVDQPAPGGADAHPAPRIAHEAADKLPWRPHARDDTLRQKTAHDDAAAGP